MNKIETEIISTLEEKLTDALSRESELLGRIKQLEAELGLHRWIPVSERLPENEIDVLTYGENCGLEIDEHCHKHGGYWVTSGNTPTHWMPIILPKE